MRTALAVTLLAAVSLNASAAAVDASRRISLCDAPPRIILDPATPKPAVSLSLPLATLGADLAIASVELPAPFSLDGTSRWSISGDTLAVSASIDARAWTALPARLVVTLVSGERLDVELPAARLVLDETAYTRDIANNTLAATHSMLRYDRETLVRLELALGETSPEIRDRAKTGLPVVRARVADEEKTITTLEAQLASAAPVTRNIATTYAAGCPAL